MVPRAVLMKSGLVSINTARQVNVAHTKTTVNAARPMSYLSKKAHSTVKRPINKNTTFKNSHFNQRVNIVKDKNVNTVRPKAIVNAVKGNNVNAIKASACWVWKPKTKCKPQMDLQDQGVIDIGCSRHMTGNMSYLIDYEEIDGGYVAFGGNPKGGKITGKDAKGVDCLPNATIFEQLALMGYEQMRLSIRSCGLLVRDATTASSLKAEQDSGNIIKTRSKATPNEAGSQGTTSGGGLRSQKTIGDTIAQTRFENVSKLSNDPLLVRDITLVNDQDDADMFDVNTLTSDEVLAEPEVVVKDVNLTIDEVTLAQALVALKSVKPKVKVNVVEEPSVPVSAASTKVNAATTTTTVIIPTLRKELSLLSWSMKKKDLVRLDEEIASKLQAEFDEEERLTREKDEANVALTEEWDDIQAKVDADYQLAQRLQAEEQEQFTTKQKATLFKELLEQRRKHFAAKRAEEKRNKPLTQA
ncbi:hypothetical protein Tco_0193789 [Tanacetum coccineum]